MNGGLWWAYPRVNVGPMSSDYTDSAASSFLSPDDDDGRINECVVDMKRALMNEKVSVRCLGRPARSGFIVYARAFVCPAGCT